MNKAKMTSTMTTSLVLFSLAIFACVNSKSIHHDPDLKIIGGKEALPHSAPYIVRLITTRWNPAKGAYQTSLCGGSILNKEYILTARHCVNGAKSITIDYAAHNVNKKEPNQKTVDGSTYVMHPWADIGLIKVSPGVEYNVDIKNISLPAAGDKTDYTSKKVLAHGWGLISDDEVLPNVLMEVELEMIDNNRCDKELRPRNKPTNQGEICTSGFGIKGTCSGDSGGPLVLNGVLIGVTSWCPAKCEAGGPSVYVSTRYYLDWIKKNAGI